MRQRPILGIELDDAVTFGIVDPVGEHRRAAPWRWRLAQQRAQAVAVEDIVAENQRRRVAGKEIRPIMNACARPPGWLHGVARVDAPIFRHRREALNGRSRPAW